MSDRCRILEWDSAFFGFRIGRVDGGRLTVEAAAAAVDWAREHGVACMYFLAAADDAETGRVAAAHGFRFVDVRVTLRASADPGIGRPAAPGVKVRMFEPHDRDALTAIARASYYDTRFYFDGGFPRERCDDLYATWIEKSCDGGADAVVVATADDEAAGFVTCHLDGARSEIGLIGVSAAHRGKGIGEALVRHALAWSRAEGASQMSVATQMRNVAALRLYQRCGFLVVSVEVWYHWWGDAPGGSAWRR